MTTTTFYFEITDTYGGEANYSWVTRVKTNAKSLHGALCKLSRDSGFNFRFDGLRYDAQNACVCAFLLDDEQAEHYKFKEV
jgi:hypothetical protein